MTEKVVGVHGLSAGNVSDPGWERFRAELSAGLEAIADVDAVVVDVLPAPDPAPCTAA